jgi:chromate transporter
MNQPPGALAVLATQFALMSLLAIGGANAAIPEMHRLAVDVQGWMTSRQFADMFALAQLTPGPNVIVVTLIGYHVAGVVGALVATIAMCGPTCLTTYFVARVWEKFKEAPWRIAIQAGLVPVSLGLIAASAWIIALTADRNMVAAAITIVTVIVGYFTRINPLWVFAVAAVIGAMGWI